MERRGSKQGLGPETPRGRDKMKCRNVDSHEKMSREENAGYRAKVSDPVKWHVEATYHSRMWIVRTMAIFS